MPLSPSSSATGAQLWKSPVPYLFGSLAITLLLIAVALIILVCSYRKRASNSSGEDEEKPAMKMMNNTGVDSEPKIVVIMAGDDKPTYLAKPVVTASSTCHCDCEQV